MALTKCPRCELNYMNDTEVYCDVCKKEMRREKDSEEQIDLCPECNEHPVVRNEELCIFCMREKKRQESVELAALEESKDDLEMNEVSGLEEIDIDLNRDIPENELEEIDEALRMDDEDEDIEEEEYRDPSEDENEDSDY